jgi:hypothetical protein
MLHGSRRMRAASGHLEQHGAERQNVGLAVDGPAFELYRRHVRNRADEGAFDRGQYRHELIRTQSVLDWPEPGDAEVRSLDAARHHNVFAGLRSRCVMPARCAASSALPRFQWPCAAAPSSAAVALEPPLQCLSLDVFHDEIVAAVLGANVVDRPCWWFAGSNRALRARAADDAADRRCLERPPASGQPCGPHATPVIH